MVENFNEWNKGEFIAFILIEASFADTLIQEDEKWIITEILSVKRFYEVLEFYRKNTDEENKQIMLTLKDKFIKRERDKDELLAQIHKIFKSDGQYSTVEKNMEAKFKEIFG